MLVFLEGVVDEELLDVLILSVRLLREDREELADDEEGGRDMMRNLEKRQCQLHNNLRGARHLPPRDYSVA